MRTTLTAIISAAAIVAATLSLQSCSGGMSESERELRDSLDHVNAENAMLRDRLGSESRDSLRTLYLLEEVDVILLNVSNSADSAEKAIGRARKSLRPSKADEIDRHLQDASRAIFDIRRAIGEN